MSKNIGIISYRLAYGKGEVLSMRSHNPLHNHIETVFNLLSVPAPSTAYINTTRLSGAKKKNYFKNIRLYSPATLRQKCVHFESAFLARTHALARAYWYIYYNIIRVALKGLPFTYYTPQNATP